MKTPNTFQNSVTVACVERPVGNLFSMKQLTEEEVANFEGFHESNRFILPEPSLTSNHHPRHPAWNPSNGVKLEADGSWHKGHTVKGYSGKGCHYSYNLDYAHGALDTDRKPAAKDKIDNMTDDEVSPALFEHGDSSTCTAGHALLTNAP